LDRFYEKNTDKIVVYGIKCQVPGVKIEKYVTARYTT